MWLMTVFKDTMRKYGELEFYWGYRLKNGRLKISWKGG